MSVKPVKESSSPLAPIGKSVLITGANQGIGLHTAILLAQKGHHIFIACRNEKRAQEAVETIKKANSSVRVEYLLVDFCDMSTVKALNESIRSRELSFDIVVLNAGVLIPKERETVDGLETCFQVNYLAQYLLVSSIVENQRGGCPLKVVTLTSVMHKLCGTLFRVEREPGKWEHMLNNKEANPWRCYAWSKFCMALLAARLDKCEGVKAVTVHPGAVRTGMVDSISPSVRKRLTLLSNMLLTPEVAAEHVIYCVENTLLSGEYRYKGHTQKLNNHVRKERNLLALREVSDQLCAPFR